MDSWQEILGNCDIRLCLGATDTLTAEYFAELLGVATVETQSIKKEAGIEGELEYGQKNISTVRRNLMNADEILKLEYNKLLVNIRGNKPVMLDKMIYTEHEFANDLKDVSVMKYIPNWNKQTTPKKVITNAKKIAEIKPKKRKIQKNVEKENIKTENRQMTFEDF